MEDVVVMKLSDLLAIIVQLEIAEAVFGKDPVSAKLKPYGNVFETMDLNKVEHNRLLAYSQLYDALDRLKKKAGIEI